jgi:hypothetical protein
VVSTHHCSVFLLLLILHLCFSALQIEEVELQIQFIDMERNPFLMDQHFGMHVIEWLKLSVVGSKNSFYRLAIIWIQTAIIMAFIM